MDAPMWFDEPMTNPLGIPTPDRWQQVTDRLAYHLNAIGFTDEQITEAAGVVVGSGRPLPASMLEIIDRWTQIEMLVGNPTPQWVYDEIARRTEYDYQYEPAERLKIIDGVVRDIAMGRLP